MIYSFLTGYIEALNKRILKVNQSCLLLLYNGMRVYQIFVLLHFDTLLSN